MAAKIAAVAKTPSRNLACLNARLSRAGRDAAATGSVPVPGDEKIQQFKAVARATFCETFPFCPRAI